MEKYLFFYVIDYLSRTIIYRTKCSSDPFAFANISFRKQAGPVCFINYIVFDWSTYRRVQLKNVQLRGSPVHLSSRCRTALVCKNWIGFG